MIDAMSVAWDGKMQHACAVMLIGPLLSSFILLYAQVQTGDVAFRYLTVKHQSFGVTWTNWLP